MRSSGWALRQSDARGRAPTRDEMAARVLTAAGGVDGAAEAIRGLARG